MPKDPQETRRLAGNYREYLADSLRSFRVYGWAWREFVTAEAKQWVYRGLLVLFLAAGFGMLQPLTLRWVADGLNEHDYNTVIWALLALGVSMLLHHGLFTVFQHCREWAIGLVEQRLDVRTTELFMQKSLGQHMQDSDELSAANVEKGRSRAFEVAANLVFNFAVSLLEITLAFLFLCVVFPTAGLAITLFIIIHLITSLCLNRNVVVQCTPIDALYRRVNRFRVERWDNIERVKTCGKEIAEIKRLRSDFGDWLKCDRNFWLWFIRMIGWRGLINLATALAIIAYSAWNIAQGNWTIGLLIPLVTWVRQIVDKMWQLGDLELKLNWSLPSVISLQRALTTKPDVIDATNAVELSADQPVRIELVDVTHCYGQGKQSNLHVLSDVNFVIEPGEKVALLGDSGAGKTTLMRLVQRFFDPTSGAILVNGFDLRQVQQESWTRLVGYIPQQSQVLDGTIRYNLLYGLSDEERVRVTDEELWRVMRLLKIDFGERLIDGLDTVVGRRGIRLSGGQAQRLMIGAAVLKKPRFMVIDEATSSLDSTTERAVQDGLQKLLGPDVSALVVTHRLSTVRELCSKFVVLRAIEDLTIGEQQVECISFSFEELYPRSATFRRLADDQGIQVIS
ncbi:ABC transporter ATP-binding protein/permease [Patescibacteria group bacterium]|nr:ABC transporter ATP-binding protein/permease [Patescibacteria group bacterium]MBU1028599.1 ABC transporter ATP-binding protein/permease [Patescibacteria group bacterium]MBU1915848.1 ABC transporter ATP-binding protein/permease [Patescibacteria group bacterium]